MLYSFLYSFAMGKCLRYAENQYDAAEILNDSFLKAFKNIEKYKYTMPFHSWFGKIISNTAIDRYRAELKHNRTEEISFANEVLEESTVFDSIEYKELLKLVQQLPVAYRTVFNLYAIDGYSHDEISKMLGISIGTSKSNLFKARHRLQKSVLQLRQNESNRFDSDNIIPIKPITSVTLSINGGGLGK
nr:RNA polymerase sigma factor [Hufsiella arboris]